MAGSLVLAAFSNVPYAPALLFLAGLGVLFGIALYIGSKKFAVKTDPRIDEIAEALPGANCGGCGFGGCRAYAEAVVLKGAAANLCAPGGAAVATKIAKIIGLEATTVEPRVAVVHCQGAPSRARSKGMYAGVLDCRAALVPGAGGGAKSCIWGCLGYGTCVAACPFGALVMGPDGLPQVIERLCTACGRCVEACPRGLIRLHAKKQAVFVLCRSHNKAKVVREVCDVGCIACKRCEKACKHDAIHVVDNVAVIDDSKCTQCAECVKVCPRGIIWDLAPVRAKYSETPVKEAL